MRFIVLLIPCFIASACATPEPPQNASAIAHTQAYAAATTGQLWATQAATSDPLALLMVEAELGSRGEFQSGTSYLGARTVSTVGSYQYGRSAPVTGDKNCGDFMTPGGAQRFFLSAGGPTYDPYGLDRDGDGNACEWGVRLREISLSRVVPVVQTAPSTKRRKYRSSVRQTGFQGSQCHVGPRGGTYTITSGGNKNYDGC